MWWLLFGGIAGFALILHGCLGVWLLRRVKALNHELDAARDRIGIAAGVPGSAGEDIFEASRQPTAGVRTYDQA